jgi:hypothetical protein
MEVF